MCGKRLLTVFLFSLFCRLSYSHQFKPIDWENIDENLNNLEMNWNMQEVERQILEKHLSDLMKEQEEYSANQSLQYQTLENKYMKLENNMKIWRTTSIILIPISIISTTITIILIESNIWNFQLYLRKVMKIPHSR